MTDAIESQIERFAPGFRDRILAKRSTSPAELEELSANLIGGDVGGGSHAGLRLFLRPVPAARPHRTPNPAIFLGSASTPPGGGVHGLCGHWAAEEALRSVLA